MIEVTCAIIELNNTFLATRRSKDMSHSGKWEFPGGKILPGETAEACICREIKEELDASIAIKHKLPEVRHMYSDDNYIVLLPFVCQLRSDRVYLKEHDACKWLDAQSCMLLDWLEADIEVVQYYLQSLSRYNH